MAFSRNTAIRLSVIAFMASLGRILLDWRYESRQMGTPGSIAKTINLLSFAALAGGWIWAMLAAIRGSRIGIITCMVFAIFLGVAFALGTYLIMCPPQFCSGFHHLWPWTWAQFISG